MQVFFSSLDEIESFTQRLHTLSKPNACQHCHQNDQWVSHGYVYKQHSIERVITVGKRIICSHRFGRQGCGRTRQLYLDSAIPNRQHLGKLVLAFISALIQGASVPKAYHGAFAHERHEPRQAWRWLNDLMHQLPYFRLHVDRRQECVAVQRTYRTLRLNILLPTLSVFIQTPYAQSHFQCALL